MQEYKSAEVKKCNTPKSTEIKILNPLEHPPEKKAFVTLVTHLSIWVPYFRIKNKPETENKQKNYETSHE